MDREGAEDSEGMSCSVHNASKGIQFKNTELEERKSLLTQLSSENVSFPFSKASHPIGTSTNNVP